MVFWASSCCWCLSLSTGCILIAVYLIISETALFLMSFLSGDVPFEEENGFFQYSANFMFFPVTAFAFQVVAALSLIASAIWRKILFVSICLGYQIIEGTIFIVILLDELLGQDQVYDEIELRVRGGAKYYFFQFGTVCLRVYFLYEVASYMSQLRDERRAAREEARLARVEARAARRLSRL